MNRLDNLKITWDSDRTLKLGDPYMNFSQHLPIHFHQITRGVKRWWYAASSTSTLWEAKRTPWKSPCRAMKSRAFCVWPCRIASRWWFPVVPGGSRIFLLGKMAMIFLGWILWVDAGVFYLFFNRRIRGVACVIFFFFGWVQDLSSPWWRCGALMKPCQEPFLIENKSSEKCPLAKSFGRQHFGWWKWWEEVLFRLGKHKAWRNRQTLSLSQDLEDDILRLKIRDSLP